jgi:lysophospholipase L1-like esterase
VDVYADSIMANNGTQERPLASVQKQYPALTFVDHSAPEVLLTDIARRFDELPRSGRWVVIESGVIDAWRNVKPALYVQALQDIIDGLRAEGREPILTGFSRQIEMPALHIRKPQLLRRARYDELTRLVALDRKVTFVDWGAVRFDGPDDLQDGIHPNRAYSDRLFQKLLSTLEHVTGCR